jgi:ketosteroid isomerase-like protein
MSQEALEIARRFRDAVDAREVPDGLVAEDCEIENLPTAVTDKTYVGPEGARRWMQDMLDAFDEEAVFEQEILRADDDWVIGLLSIRGHGSSSGLPLELRWAAVMWFRDGLITRAAGFASRREAFAAVGREPPS